MRSWLSRCRMRPMVEGATDGFGGRRALPRASLHFIYEALSDGTPSSEKVGMARLRLMPRRFPGLLLLAVLAAALAGGAAAAVDRSGAGGSGVELVDGSGRAYLGLRGALLGSLGRGRLAVTPLPSRERTEVFVQGAEWERELADGTTVYGGDALRFRVFRGAWRVRLQGSGINASAVGRGLVRLQGTGQYSLGGQPYQPWPAEWQTIRLGD